MLTNRQIADALGVTPQRVIALRKRGMPDGPEVTLEQIVAWRNARITGNAVPQAPTVEASTEALAAGSLEERISRHKLRVDEAERVWQQAMLGGDGNSSKYQTAYNQSLKTLVALENEAFNRKVKAGEFVRRSDSEAVALALVQAFIGETDKMPDALAELCNPDNPGKARKVLEKWAIDTRRSLSAKVENMVDEEAAP